MCVVRCVLSDVHQASECRSIARLIDWFRSVEDVWPLDQTTHFLLVVLTFVTN
jgi:hypothetical protein